jgi:hypothetical protein
MKFARILLRIKSFWTAFALGIIFVAVFSDNVEVSPILQIETSPVRRTANPAKPVANEDYAVFSAVMEQHLSARETYIIGDEAFDEAPENAQNTNRGSSRESRETLNDYIAKNKEPRSLQNRFALKSQSPVILFSREEKDEAFAKNEAGWDKFFEKYPQSSGIINFSNVGFNREKTEALVRVKYLCALCSGKETFYLLTKQGEQWRICMQ